MYPIRTQKRVEPKVDELVLKTTRYSKRLSQWPRGLRRVYGRSPAEIVGSNPIGGMDVYCDCCMLSGRGL